MFNMLCFLPPLALSLLIDSVSSRVI